MYLAIDKKYLFGGAFVLLGLSYVALSITSYKKENKTQNKM
jgi:hypothetical protein